MEPAAPLCAANIASPSVQHIMAEEEALQPQESAPEVAEPSPAVQKEDVDPEARYRYDESMLIKGKGGGVKKPEKPDENERNSKVELLKVYLCCSVHMSRCLHLVCRVSSSLHSACLSLICTG